MKKNKFFSFIIAFFFFLIILSDLFGAEEGTFSYGDEIISILFFLYFLYCKLSYMKVRKTDSIILSCVIIIILIGLGGNFIYSFQTNMYVICLDILSSFKYIFLFLGLNEFLNNKERNLNGLVVFLFSIYKLYMLIMFACAIANQFMDIGMSVEYRYGIKGFSFITYIPGIVISHCSYFLLFLLKEKKDRYYFWSIIAIFVMISTLKSRAFILAAAYIFIIIARDKKIKINKMHVCVILLVLLIIGYPQFKVYFILNKSPRYVFLHNSIVLANNYFPFGTGFSTYGTGTAAHHYSLVYYMLGFDKLYGMGPEGNMFLCDTFFPAMLGQFGYIGFVIYVFLMAYFSYLVISKTQKNSIYVSIYFIIIIWISSIQSAYFTTSAMTCSLIICLILTRSIPRKKRAGDKI